MTTRAWTWRHAVAKSTLEPTTRHVLLTISLFMNDFGGGCYPTIEDLKEATGLTDRAVIKHVGIAQRLGWIDVKKHGFKGQRWKNNEYSPKWPDLVEQLEQPTAKVRKSRAKPAENPEPPAVENDADDLFGSAGNPIEGHEPGSLPQDPNKSPEVMNLTTKGHEPNDVKVMNHVPTILPDSFQIPSTKARERAEGREDFSKFWEAWPASERPDNRGLAAKLFLALSQVDRLAASGAAETYRRVMRQRGWTVKMIPFLKDRLFEDFGDAGPPVDGDGDFVIKPERPEWPAWLEYRRATNGDAGVEATKRAGLVIAKMRWPPAAEPATVQATK